MTENLKVTHYPDKSTIAYSDIYHIGGTVGHKIDGYVYHNTAANNACPENWHLPSDEEWKELEIFIGMDINETNNEGFRGVNEATKLKAKYKWLDSSCEGTDNYGFSALPNGYVRYDGIIHSGVTRWWTKGVLSRNESMVVFREISNGENCDKIGRYYAHKNYYHSIRCVKD